MDVCLGWGGLSLHTYGPSPLVYFAVVSHTIDLTDDLLSLLKGTKVVKSISGGGPKCS